MKYASFINYVKIDGKHYRQYQFKDSIQAAEFRATFNGHYYQQNPLHVII